MALGIGLLIGVERERRKGEGPTRSPAGIRTFAAASLVGAISFVAGGQVLFAISTVGVILLAAMAYSRGHEADPGLTTEIALIGTTLLGGLSMQTPVLAAGLGVIVAILLAARTPLHRFARSLLTEDELKDALLLAGATLVVLPLLPNRQMGPFGALNPQSIWMLVILVMVIGAVGHVPVRTLDGMAYRFQDWQRGLFQAQRRSLQWERDRQRRQDYLRQPCRPPYCRTSQQLFSSHWFSPPLVA